jgi:hypothetical protein
VMDDLDISTTKEFMLMGHKVHVVDYTTCYHCCFYMTKHCSIAPCASREYNVMFVSLGEFRYDYDEQQC